MKRVLKFCLSAIMIAAAVSLTSCQPEDLNNDPGNTGGGQTGTFPEPLDHSDVNIPIGWGEYSVEASGLGVSIEVTSVEEKDFTFICRPGASVKSFKMCAYPLAQIYNVLLEQDMLGADPVDVEEALRLYLDERNSGASSGMVGGSDVYYSESVNGDDYSELEFKWSEAPYTYSAPIVPDAEYLIVTLAYLEDVAAGEQGALSVCYLRTDSKPLVGNPGLTIQIIPYYAGFEARYRANNSSAAGFYEYIGVKEEVEEYIETFGRRLYRDYLRTWRMGEAYDFESSNASIQIELGEDDKALVAAVAVDVNGTPTADFEQADSQLKPLPEGMVDATATLSIVEDKVGSMIFWVEADMDEFTRDVNIRVLPADQAAPFRKGGNASDEERAALAANLCLEGWRIQNPNFHFDEENNRPFDDGDGAVVRDIQVDMKSILSGKEYAVVYVARNFYNIASEVKVSDVVTTKTRNVTDPDAFKKTFEVKTEKPTPIGFTIHFTFNPEEVATYYWQIVSPTENGQANPASGNKPQIPGFWEANKPLDLTGEHTGKPVTHADWVKYYFEAVDQFNNPLCNVWFYNPLDETTVDNGDGTVTDSWTFADMVAGTQYEIAFAAEDWDGNLSETTVISQTTQAMNPGPDPEITLVCQPSQGTPGFTGQVTLVKDIAKVLVMYGETEAEIGVDPELILSGSDRYYYNEYIKMMRDRVIGAGEDGETGGLSYYTDVPLSYSGEGPCFVLCVPVGEDEYGEVFGDLKYAIYYNGKIHYNISDFGIAKQ